MYMKGLVIFRLCCWYNVTGLVSGNYVSGDVIREVGCLTIDQKDYVSEDIHQHSGKDDT